MAPRVRRRTLRGRSRLRLVMGPPARTAVAPPWAMSGPRRSRTSRRRRRSCGSPAPPSGKATRTTWRSPARARTITRRGCSGGVRSVAENGAFSRLCLRIGCGLGDARRAVQARVGRASRPHPLFRHEHVRAVAGRSGTGSSACIQTPCRPRRRCEARLLPRPPWRPPREEASASSR